MSKTGLMAEFMRAQVESGAVNTQIRDFRHPTGFDLIDLCNGASSPGGAFAGGLRHGSLLTLVGLPGSGKTTLAIQVAARIASSSPEGFVLHYDVEGGTSMERVSTLTGMAPSELDGLYNLIQVGCCTEKFHENLNELHKYRMANEEALECRLTGTDGVERTVMAPAVVILDSLASLQPEGVLDKDEVAKGMAGAQVAKMNNAWVRQLKGKLHEANIHLVIVNHINARIQLDGPPGGGVPDMNFLGKDEALPGGREANYQADCLLRLNPRGTKFTPDREFGIKGYSVVCRVIKSRSAPAGVEHTLILDQEKGFSNTLSNFTALKAEGAIQGTGRAYWLKGDKDAGTFTKRSLQERLESDPGLADAFGAAVREFALSKAAEAGFPDGDPPPAESAAAPTRSRTRRPERPE